jgi:hypothetical protein
VQVFKHKSIAALSGTAVALALVALSFATPSSGGSYTTGSIPGSPDIAPGTAVTTIGGQTVTAQLSETPGPDLYAALDIGPSASFTPTVVVSIKAGSSGLGLATPYVGSLTYDPNNSTVTLSDGVTVDLAGYGLAPGTIVNFDIYSSGISLGSTKVAANGTYSYVITVPPGLSQGAHTLAAKGTSKNGKAFKLSVGLKVKAPKTFTVGPFVSGYTLSSALQTDVRNLANLIKAQHNTHVVLTGYTDSTGTAAGNKAESVDRARQVGIQLAADLAGAKDSNVKIVLQGDGSKSPVSKQPVLNRRVVATLS